MLALALPFGLAGWYLARMRLDAPPRLSLSLWLALMTLLPLGMLLQVAQPSLLAGFLGQLGALFTSSGWQTLGWALAALVYIPLAYQMLRSGERGDIRRDLAAIGACLGLVALLFAQAGFDGIGQWESWPTQAHLEGRASKVEAELIIRFWSPVPPCPGCEPQLALLCRLSSGQFLHVLGHAGAFLWHLAAAGFGGLAGFPGGDPVPGLSRQLQFDVPALAWDDL